MNLKSLEIYYWVVTLNGFQKAATKMNTTQPAVSQRVAALEAELGIKALDRTSRSFRVTSAGRVLYEYAERFLRLRSELLVRVAEQEAMKGSIRLGVAETIVHTWLVDFIQEAHRHYPQLTIDIVIDITPTLREAVIRGELDMAFLLGPLPESELVEHELCSYELNFMASPGLKLPNRSLSVEDLAAQPLITFPKRTYPYTYLMQALARPDGEAPRIFTNWSLSTILKMTEDGFGVCVAPRLAAVKEIGQGSLVVKRSTVALHDLRFAVAYAKNYEEPVKEALAGLARTIAAGATKRRPAARARAGKPGPKARSIRKND